MKQFKVASAVILCTFATPIYAGQVTLTGNAVTSAIDIEMAIATATKYGSESGVVILDGSGGNFNFTGDDKSVNLIYSNIQLLGINQAKITNCDDGLVLAAENTLSQILIKGITFECSGNGITDLGQTNLKENVSVIKNTFKAPKNGIYIHNADKWNIVENDIQAGTQYPIPGDTTTVISLYFSDSANSNIMSNKLSGYDGIRLDLYSNQNNIANNKVCIYNNPGLFLDNTTHNNNIIMNEVASSTIDNVVAVENLGTMNIVVRNVVVQQCR